MMSLELDSHLKIATGVIFEVKMRLDYNPADPWALTLTFLVPGYEETVWTFGRELLAQGLQAPTGFGDIRIDTYPEMIGLKLAGIQATSEVFLPRQPVSDFLADTVALCPPGLEDVDWDDIVARLVG
jgi:Streptomyces sporulation and cell division protein, SsgA